MQITSTQSQSRRLMTIALIAIALGIGSVAASTDGAAARDPMLEEVAENTARASEQQCSTGNPLLTDPDALRSDRISWRAEKAD